MADLTFAGYLNHVIDNACKWFADCCVKDCMWVAKSRIDGRNFGDKKFTSAVECMKFINSELKYANKFLQMYVQELKDLRLDFLNYNGGMVIQCYNITQKRWADGFDF